MPKMGNDGNVDEESTPEKSPRSGNTIYPNYYKHHNLSNTQTHKPEKVQQNQQKLPVLILIPHVTPTFHLFLGGDEFGSVEDLDDQDVTIQSESEEDEGEITDQPGGSQVPQGAARTNGNFDTARVQPTDTPRTSGTATPGLSSSNSTPQQGTPCTSISNLFANIPTTTQAEREAAEQTRDLKRVR